MKPNLKKLLIFIAFSGVLLGFTNHSSLKKKITGHWMTTTSWMSTYPEYDTLTVEDTITFTRIKYDDKLYHWGGGAVSGIEFKGDSDFTQYQNVHCSDETDTRIDEGEKYYFVSDSVVDVKGFLREFRFKVMYMDGEKLIIRIMHK